MSKIAELKEKRAKIWEEAKALNEQISGEGRGYTQDEEQRWDRMNKDMDDIAKQIEREERLASVGSDLDKREGHQGSGEFRGNEQRDGREPQSVMATEEYRAAFKSWVMNGFDSLAPEQRSILTKGRQSLSGDEQRAMSAITGSAGGYTVPQGFYDQLIEGMKFFGGMRQSRATVLRTKSGNQIPIPTNDDTSNVGAIVGENTAVGNATDPVFAQKLLGAYKYTSKTFLVPIELLQDSAFDIEAYIRRKIQERIGRILNTHFTVGTGASQPQGVATGASIGKTGATGQTVSVTTDDLVDLEHSIDILYRANAEYMFNDTTLKALRKLKDADGRPLWQPGLSGFTSAAPDTINGKPYIVNNDVAQMAANAKSILFGDFSNYIIRDVMDLMIVRMGEKYIESGQIGFVAFSRHDGLYVDAGQGPIKAYQNSAT